MKKISYKRKYFTRFSIEQHCEIVKVEQLEEIKQKFYLTNAELSYLFGTRPNTFKKILNRTIPLPFIIQLALYYLMQDPAMIYKLIKEKKKFDKAKRKAEELLEQQGTA